MMIVLGGSTPITFSPFYCCQRRRAWQKLARSTVSQTGSAALKGYDSEALLWLELFTLWAKMRKIGWDVSSLDEFRTVILQVSRLAANSPSAAYPRLWPPTLHG